MDRNQIDMKLLSLDLLDGPPEDLRRPYRTRRIAHVLMHDEGAPWLNGQWMSQSR